MRLRHLAVCAAFAALAACDGTTTDPILPAGRPALAEAAPTWKLYTNQQHTEELDATGGWEVGTGFTSSKPGRIIGFRFYRAPGETGYNYGKLFAPNGERLKKSDPFPAGTGWVTVMLNTPVFISANTTYRVSVNTNVRQVKKLGGYAYDGPLSNGPLYSSAGFYGQPAGSRPTTQSGSYFFVDVIFEEVVPPAPKPDLFVGGINPFDYANVHITICNQGAGDAPASTTQFAHWLAPTAGGPGDWRTPVPMPFPAIPANTCATRSTPSASLRGYHNEYHVWADHPGAIAESVETNNYTRGWWQP